MASLRQLKDKIKTFGDIKKVINIQKIAIMKEISDIKKIIQQVSFRAAIFNNYMLDINKKYSVYDNSMFSHKKKTTNAPHDRTLHFIVGNPKSDKLGEYAHKLMLDHIKKNHAKEDVYAVVDLDLAEFLITKGVRVIKKMSLGEDVTDSKIYERISWQLYQGYTNLLFTKASFSYLSMITKQIKQSEVFPFLNKKVELDDKNIAELGVSGEVFKSANVSNAEWIKDLGVVSEKILKLSIEMKVYGEIVEYRLSLKTRELQSLDDKDKNIKEEVEKVKIDMQRIRKEAITNELLTSAVAFSVVGTGSDDHDEDGEYD